MKRTNYWLYHGKNPTDSNVIILLAYKSTFIKKKFDFKTSF